MTLDDPLNKIQLPGHQGPHGKFVNGLIYEELEKATMGLSGVQREIALKKALGSLGDKILNTDFGDLFRAAASKIDVMGRF